MTGALPLTEGNCDSLVAGVEGAAESIPSKGVESAAESIPSKGSSPHQWGACKPCAFFLKDGCENGVDCVFCHLCDAGERKRRKKERREIKKELRVKFRASNCRN
jgi:hypothetical protein